MARNALLNALQAASNEAAGTISGPVDLLSWGLRKAGVPVPQNALLSSEWMRQKGLLGDVQQGPSQVAGATLGLLSPIAAAAKAPQIARGLLAGEEATKRGAYAVGEKANDMAQAYMARQGLMKPATVWHGSPHKFDKFDSSKIGTGEGAQAYGHGLYLAESPDVGRQYAQQLGDAQSVLDAAPQSAFQKKVQEKLRRGVQESRGDGAGTPTIDDFRDWLNGMEGPHVESAYSAPLTALERLANRGGGGQLYKVDLPDEKIARMLDWDAPLSQQSPEVRAAAEALGLGRPYQGGMPVRDIEAQGMQVYSDLSRQTRGAKSAADAAAAQRLRELGIPGIRYLDGGSRGAGGGTSNFVLFPGEENALTILERNGQRLR